jgi:hypothetical protein
MKNKKLRIAIIDDGIDLKLLNQIFNRKIDIRCLQIVEDICVEQYLLPLQTINHGTLCAAILLEQLSKLGTVEYVEIVSISILDDRRCNSLQNLNQAIIWGITHKIDVISMSVGTKEFTFAKIMIDELKKNQENHTIIIAAGANDDKITYPACLPSVIGVKTINKDNYKEYISLEPIDGLDVSSYIPKLEVLEKFDRDYNYASLATNSMLAPIITAYTANILIENDVRKRGLDAIKRYLAKSIKINMSDDIFPITVLINSTIIVRPEIDIRIPVIAMVYNSSDRENIAVLANLLQKEFIKNEYNCACLSDRIMKNDFESNYFRLPLENTEVWVQFYTSFLNASVILILCDYKVLESHSYSNYIDAIITKDKESFSSQTYLLASEDIDYECHNIYRWIINLFENQD